MPENAEKQGEGGTPGVARPAAWRSDLPQVRAPIPADQVIARLQRASRRGELPGFAELGGSRFQVAAFGTHFDRTLMADAAPSNDSSAICFVSNRHWKILVIVWVVFAFTLWPGVWMTHSMLLTWFGWYRLPMWGTVAWYVPLTLLCIPALLKMQRASDQASWAHAHETILKVARICDGKVEQN